jgi:hypothetical protein
MDSQEASLETLKDIRRMMDRSSRFISLSGLSGVSAGFFALIGAYIAHGWLKNGAEVDYTRNDFLRDGNVANIHQLKWKLALLAAIVLLAALCSAFYFTWRKTKSNNLPMWDITSKKLVINLLIPLISGGFFVLGLLYHETWVFVAPACLVFYGLALVNASKYTLSDIRYIGFFEIILGLINMFFVGYGLYFWAMGFGFLHIVYGMIMWWKYDRRA